MLIEADLNSLTEYINIWNKRFDFGLTYQGNRDDRAVWSTEISLITLSKAAPGLIAFEVDNFKLGSSEDASMAIAQRLLEIIARNFPLLHPADYRRIPGESARIVTKTQEDIGILPVLADVPLTPEAEAEFKARLRNEEPDATDSELDDTWMQMRLAIEAAHARARDLAQDRIRRSKLTADLAAKEFLEESTTSINNEEPWKQIPDKGHNRAMLKLWHEGLTAGEIALRVNMSPKTITNRISELRRIFGESIVPRRR